MARGWVIATFIAMWCSICATSAPAATPRPPASPTVEIVAPLDGQSTSHTVTVCVDTTGFAFESSAYVDAYRQYLKSQTIDGSNSLEVLSRIVLHTTAPYVLSEAHLGKMEVRLDGGDFDTAAHSSEAIDNRVSVSDDPIVVYRDIPPGQHTVEVKLIGASIDASTPPTDVVEFVVQRTADDGGCGAARTPPDEPVVAEGFPELHASEHENDECQALWYWLASKLGADGQFFTAARAMERYQCRGGFSDANRTRKMLWYRAGKSSFDSGHWRQAADEMSNAESYKDARELSRMYRERSDLDTAIRQARDLGKRGSKHLNLRTMELALLTVHRAEKIIGARYNWHKEFEDDLVATAKQKYDAAIRAESRCTDLTDCSSPYDDLMSYLEKPVSQDESSSYSDHETGFSSYYRRTPTLARRLTALARRVTSSSLSFDRRKSAAYSAKSYSSSSSYGYSDSYSGGYSFCYGWFCF